MNIWSFEDYSDLTLLAGRSFSIPLDFVIKASGRGCIYGSDLGGLPLINDSWQPPVINRTLRLVSCILVERSLAWAVFHFEDKETVKAMASIQNRRAPSPRPRSVSSKFYISGLKARPALGVSGKFS